MEDAARISSWEPLKQLKSLGVPGTQNPALSLEHNKGRGEGLTARLGAADRHTGDRHTGHRHRHTDTVVQMCLSAHRCSHTRERTWPPKCIQTASSHAGVHVCDRHVDRHTRAHAITTETHSEVSGKERNFVLSLLPTRVY